MPDMSGEAIPLFICGEKGAWVLAHGPSTVFICGDDFTRSSGQKIPQPGHGGRDPRGPGHASVHRHRNWEQCRRTRDKRIQPTSSCSGGSVSRRRR